MGAVIARPSLPPGPFVVVGLARSGVAAALALRERGEAVVGTDLRQVDAEVKERLETAGLPVVVAGNVGTALVSLHGTLASEASPGSAASRDAPPRSPLARDAPPRSPLGRDAPPRNPLGRDAPPRGGPAPDALVVCE